jgi:hypothetical protein
MSAIALLLLLEGLLGERRLWDHEVPAANVTRT